MLNSQILDVAIGLALMYLFQSMLVSGITEVISIASSAKGKFLKRSLQKVFQLETSDRAFYIDVMHSPFISKYYQSGKYPSYIQTEDFTSAVLSVLNSKGGQDNNYNFDKIKAGIETYPKGNFVSFLNASALMSNDDLEVFKGKIVSWFNGYMGEVSDWYKNKIRVLTALLALVITVLLNVDSFSIMNELWKNDKVRESSVMLAEEVYKKEYLNTTQDSTTQVATDANNLIQSVNVHYNMLYNFDFPITWEYEYRKKVVTTEISQMSIWQKLWWSICQLSLEKILGFLITTAAVTMGTPLWYDLLKKLIDIKTKKNTDATAE